MIARAMDYSGELTFNTAYQDGAPKKVMDDAKFRTIFPDFAFYDMEQGIRNTVAYYEMVTQEAASHNA
jgi:GDP-L-fucose synthase